MDQNCAAFTLLSDFIKESKRKKPEYAALAGMADAMTQGQGGDVVVVVIGTTGRVPAAAPIYCLRTQLRMATGLFELCHAEVYSDLPFQYGPGCDVSLPLILHRSPVGGLPLEEVLRPEAPSHGLEE
ncbi:hypothetical protein CEP52_007607 [Fusarium oligoseptatum]|uniref:Uncharacterized protein n=1 Tax=Fusarium oligoseptatum TaxID=2604345 RepID=A0A428TM38_9HYPO|nr:hypothetical protein CEP52_007607 [Fusarium oligoseptatum]